MQDNAGDDITPSSIPDQDEVLSMDNAIPGNPLLSIDDQPAVGEFLRAELSTMRLRRVYGILFLTSKPDNISPLHHQQIKGRDICITERPDLHLVWHYERIFIKPIPESLFSSEFWEKHIVGADTRDTGSDSFRAEAEGFLRTYARLITHESDLHLAKRLHLVPGTLTWNGWCHYIQRFRYLRDRDVAQRYHFGEIRLTRLNFWHSLRHGRSYFQVHHNYATFFARFGAPYIFVFGAATVFLTALQTGLAAYPQWGIYQDLASRIVPFTLIPVQSCQLYTPISG
ncbi:hypothetical protein MHUMG1_07323 [Metarhizium humberi]|uniref:Subtilisin-like serine protease n=1 Tax=Metarhizium humberi TaxID=2596975 RepID=A0A9P8S676_9HYPO|nr:hypothetical protein MHUMG1_07323 [Metarhizium humberi]